ncbi:uncharacterized protein LOC125177913 [Hyalella azteca]|uniref:Uncharacterized protein LOC125177913 n=1 Tax=Hyalella azteca TaxID=294128 RepID=A0A979FHX6_HYAAZ|nr:uncharacterized protein LOC125177913 [Hyalella azteca]
MMTSTQSPGMPSALLAASKVSTILTRDKFFGKKRNQSTSSTASVSSMLTTNARLRQYKPNATPTAEGRFKLKDTEELNSELLSCDWSPDGSTVALARRDGAVSLRNWTDTAPSPCELKAPREVACATTVAWIPVAQQPTLIVAYSDGRLVTWRGTNILQEVHDERLVDLKVHVLQCGSIVTSAADEVHLRDAATLTKVATFTTRLGGQGLLGFGRVATVTGGGPSIIGGGAAVWWWDARTGDIVRRIPGSGVRGDALHVHPAQDKVLSAAWLTKEVIGYGGAEENLVRGCTCDDQTVGVLRGLRYPVWSLKAAPGRGSAQGKMAVAAGNYLHFVEITK